ncbi:hypothetical protein KIPB_002834 [Kipferlia bialata]|uniref:Uncharacterized protein n=1 Tax=Kipferlia bialata TaxID=797122 RepID=A0A9K3CS08_9EUKA|nr:hypothetical protein KIPB_002834 [Kipferlia bialata]|eukprot:g2834.t1
MAPAPRDTGPVCLEDDALGEIVRADTYLPERQEVVDPATVDSVTKRLAPETQGTEKEREGETDSSDAKRPLSDCANPPSAPAPEVQSWGNTDCGGVFSRLHWLSTLTTTLPLGDTGTVHMYRLMGCGGGVGVGMMPAGCTNGPIPSVSLPPMLVTTVLVDTTHDAACRMHVLKEGGGCCSYPIAEGRVLQCSCPKICLWPCSSPMGLSPLSTLTLSSCATGPRVLVWPQPLPLVTHVALS